MAVNNDVSVVKASAGKGRHIALENIKELRQLVETGAPHNSPNPRNARIISQFVVMRPFLPGRGHHREVHRCGDEAAWWEKAGIKPSAAARTLCLTTHPHARRPSHSLGLELPRPLQWVRSANPQS
jgi:hypothetical protein